MADESPWDIYRSWTGHYVHPDAPAGGGGPGSFSQAGPLGVESGRKRLPHPDSPAGQFQSHEVHTAFAFQRIRALKLTYERAIALAPGAVWAETGYQLGGLLQGLLPGLLRMLAVLGITSALGAGAGATVGAFVGGVGAAPGAVVGAELGLEVGTAALSWLGLAFLASAIGKGLGELRRDLTRAIRLSWGAAEKNDAEEHRDIERAAEGLAHACAVLFRLILQAILAWVLKNAAVGSSKAILATGQNIARVGAQPTADASVAAVAALLRKSRLPTQFVDWIEANWEDLKRNPKLKSRTVEGVASTAGTGSAVTPSEARAGGGASSNTMEKEKPDKEKPEKKVANNVDGALPNAENAVIDPKKLTDYALNPDHPVGGNKAVVFDRALGYNQSNAGDLVAQIQKGVAQNPAVTGKADQFGQRYTVDMPITGPNGNTATVRTGWIFDPASTVPRLTTAYVK